MITESLIILREETVILLKGPTRPNIFLQIDLDSWTTCGSYLIFVISFTQTGFSETKYYTQKTTKGTKKTKNVSEKVKYIHFFHSIWKNLHQTENFYTDMFVVSVTNMRYGQ